jgi:protein SCO1
MHKLLCLALLLFAACQQRTQRTQSPTGLPYYHTADFTPLWPDSKAALDTLHRLAPFRLMNQDGQQISDSTFRGKIHVANFFFTSCPSLCPRTMAAMKTVQQAFRKDPAVLLASYSVLPERDSVAVLRQYAAAHGITSPQWHLVTGDHDAVYTLARRSYFADENLGVQKGVTDFLHSENFILVDKHLHIRGIYNGTLPLDINQLIEDIRLLERE